MKKETVKDCLTHFKSFSVILSLVFALTACKKDSNVIPAISIAGTWEGNWGNANQTPTNYMKVVLNNDGSMQRLNEQGEVIANGTWILNGVQFECTYTHTVSAGGQTHKIGGLYTDFDSTIIGTWGYSPSKANGGTISLSGK